MDQNSAALRSSGFLALKAAAFVHRKLRGFIQRYGTPGAKRKLWDAEFRSGKWSGLERMDGDCVYPAIERYTHGGTILDLGCGPGATANEIGDCYSWYTGVDVSEVAVLKAATRSRANGRHTKCEFVQSDIGSYVPGRQYDVIMFADSLYYMPEHAIPKILARYARHLSPTGKFIVRVKAVRPEWFDDSEPERREFAQWARRKAVISTIRRNYIIIEQKLFDYSDKIAVIVFEPSLNSR